MFRVFENAETMGAPPAHLKGQYARGDINQPAYKDAMKKLRWREVCRAARRLRNDGPLRPDTLRRAAEIHIRFEGGTSYQMPAAKRDIATLAERGCLAKTFVKSKSSRGRGVVEAYEYIRDFDEDTDWVEEIDSHFAALRRCGARARRKDRENQKRLKFLRRLTDEKGTLTIDYDYE